MGVVPTPVSPPPYGVQGRYLYFDELRLPWVFEGPSGPYPGDETYPGEGTYPGGGVYIVFDETTGPVSVDGPYILIEEPDAT